jgi:dihydroorotate dehydrogenase electron transfer subunit
MIEVNRGSDPLLKRPFSFFRRTPGGVQLLYRIKGRGTSLLREMKKGDTIEVVGPLGAGYPAAAAGQTPLVIAGGVGVASVFPFLLENHGKAVVFYGARSGDEILMFDELRDMARELHISTDDGSLGTKGNVVGMLSRYLEAEKVNIQKQVLYACGPHPMLKAVSKISALWCVTAYISMEENMACGLGACLGCVVKTKDGYKRVCKEGPVFKTEEIVW